MDTKEILIKAKGLIDSPEKWCKGGFAVDINNHIVSVKSESAVCWCAGGATRKFTGMHNWQVGEVALSRFKPSGFNSVFGYNDHPDTTHEDIMNLFDKAIAAATNGTTSQ